MSQTVDTEDVDESRQEQDHSRSQDQDKDQDRSGSSRSRSRSGSEDSTRPSSPEPSRNRADLSNSNSFSPGFDNNTSYSRIGYGNEVDESMEDEDEEVEMSGSSKLKVFSFAGEHIIKFLFRLHYSSKTFANHKHLIEYYIHYVAQSCAPGKRRIRRTKATILLGPLVWVGRPGLSLPKSFPGPSWTCHPT